LIDIKEVDPRRLAKLEGVVTDVDDTLSTGGKLTREAYGALWDLHEAGLKVIPVTGRSAGWCDLIARAWPVDAVVGENGAFYFYLGGKRLERRYVLGEQERREHQRRLRAIGERILKEVPGTAPASSNAYTVSDLAIDFCEDVAALSSEDVMRIKSIFEEEGAQAKISSIHVNGWFGDYDKLSTTRRCVSERFGIDLDRDKERFAFCGDSPNDEPMFAFFPLSIGMANVRRYAGGMDHPPAYVTSRACGAGFVEVAAMILEAKREA